MKKEWIYFVAGAGLMASVMTFNMPKKTLTDCVAVAQAVENKNYQKLDFHNREIAHSLKIKGGYGDVYRWCMTIADNED